MALPMRLTHLCESDKAVEVGRLSTELETPHRGNALHDECRALTHKVNELLIVLSAESAELHWEITCYIMRIVQVIMAGEGL